ncbi:hypothetical protein PUNSTDRAFT_55723 [Punctularia strigosozonata HHB-11173 SS5]|uniref:Uncharacterized protein n=1 Tax=Punctularia strigosozonata (strain HHB-11173) TaxID=741275 RepID=R7S194_PUNST|nr:uncharacterized protein PUNSTDRAFT_55723 [Punctularia strigosozonata HHB-11173 SS5]EIN04145.1 hypothetical protein PUNSTDRAFT_55723 [Punctularia strigosozonata HHB-11173 SS5]
MTPNTLQDAATSTDDAPDIQVFALGPLADLCKSHNPDIDIASLDCGSLAQAASGVPDSATAAAATMQTLASNGSSTSTARQEKSTAE